MSEGTAQGQKAKGQEQKAVPEGWEKLRLGAVADVVTGNTPSTKTPEYYGSSIPFISPSDLGSHKYVSDSERSLSNKGAAVARVIPNGSVMVVCIGSTIGKIGIAAKSVATNQQINSVIAGVNSHSEYLYYALLRAESDIRDRAGTQAVPLLNKTDFANTEVLLPPLPEQRRIAAILSEWDDSLSTLTRLIEAKRQQKRGLAEQLLTGKRRLKGFEGEWVERELGSILKQVKRPVAWNDEAIYEQITIKRRSGGIVFREPLRGSEILTKKMNIAVAGDFLISKMQVVHGASALVRELEAGKYYSDSYVALIPVDHAQINMEFFSHLSAQESMYEKYLRASYGVHIEKMTFNLELYLKDSITVPPLSEQQAIASVLSTLDGEISSLEALKASVGRQKRGLMDALLTGRVRVRVEEA